MLCFQRYLPSHFLSAEHNPVEHKFGVAQRVKTEGLSGGRFVVSHSCKAFAPSTPTGYGGGGLMGSVFDLCDMLSSISEPAKAATESIAINCVVTIRVPDASNQMLNAALGRAVKQNKMGTPLTDSLKAIGTRGGQVYGVGQGSVGPVSEEARSVLQDAAGEGREEDQGFLLLEIVNAPPLAVSEYIKHLLDAVAQNLGHKMCCEHSRRINPRKPQNVEGTLSMFVTYHPVYMLYVPYHEDPREQEQEALDLLDPNGLNSSRHGNGIYRDMMAITMLQGGDWTLFHYLKMVNDAVDH